MFDEVANLLNLEVDLLFFDTTSTYFEREDVDEPVARDDKGRLLTDARPPAEENGEPADQAGFPTFGRSKDSRDDLPQIAVGMAVTRDGIPVRVWSWPGNTGDSKLIRQVKDDMRDWTGLLRRDRPEHAGPGGADLRNRTVRDCHSPEAATRDQHLREQLVSQLTTLIEDTDKLSDFKRGELRGKIADKPGLTATSARPGQQAPHRHREDQDRGAPRRQLPAAMLRPGPVRGGHRARLQASSKSSGAGGT
ncbi:hypothetical protein [Streptomyces sp. NPDC096153]|uniref:hypothetical protein n=1 Tax=Streptomyces sp. NPDC096153 TaxID=3155548 RepID=UPI00331FA12A